MERNYSNELIALARGSNKVVNRYKGFIVNGFKYHTKDREKFRKTHNNGVMVGRMEKSIMVHLKIFMSLIIIKFFFHFSFSIIAYTRKNNKLSKAIIQTKKEKKKQKRKKKEKKLANLSFPTLTCKQGEGTMDFLENFEMSCILLWRDNNVLKVHIFPPIIKVEARS